MVVTGDNLGDATMSLSRHFRRTWLRKLAMMALVFTFVALYMRPPAAPLQYIPSAVVRPFQAFLPDPEDRTPYESLEVSGYVNVRIPNGTSCDDIAIHGQRLDVAKSIYLPDDLLDIAETIIHPMVDYSGQPTGTSFRQTVAKTWGIMAGSSTWLAKYNVYFSVSRVFFYSGGVRHWPRISFVHARVYDASWNQLYNFNISWQGEIVTFPRILSIPTFYLSGGGFYGPEDPRIILEQNVDDPEPVIVFNMKKDEVNRAMFVHRPFSNFTTELIIDVGQGTSEKNWSPFFLPHDQVSRTKWPSKYIHFVYDWHPFKILRCHLLNGVCSYIFTQDQPGIKWSAYTGEHAHKDTKGVMRGGSNFEPLDLSLGPGLTSFVGFPRTHTDAGCSKEAIYRPFLTVMTTNGTHFFLDYISEALDFGHAVLDDRQYNSVCDEGRILLVNSINKFDSSARHDVMSLSMTVADSTVQVAQLRGVRNLVENLPQFYWNKTAAWHEKALDYFRLNVTHDVLICGIQTASDYAILHTNVTDRVAFEQERKAALTAGNLTTPHKITTSEMLMMEEEQEKENKGEKEPEDEGENEVLD